MAELAPLWNKHWTRGFLRKKQPTRSSPLHSSLPGTGQLTGYFCPRHWPLSSISQCPHPVLCASLPADPNRTYCRLQFLVQQWRSWLFPTDIRMRWFIFNHASLEQQSDHALCMCLVLLCGLLFLPSVDNLFTELLIFLIHTLFISKFRQSWKCVYLADWIIIGTLCVQFIAL